MPRFRRDSRRWKNGRVPDVNTRPAQSAEAVRPRRILVVDNYDSFVYNLVHYLAQVGAEVDVWRNDDQRFAEPGFADSYDGILLSPGPGTPEHAGVCVDLVKQQGGKLPIFGVCLGLQAIGVAYGGFVGRAPELLHGKTSLVQHDGTGVFAGLPSPFTATRYHSLAIMPDSLPEPLELTARTDSGVIMGVRHRSLPVEAVQFHPESVLTEHGYQLLANWLRTCGDEGAPARAEGLAPLMSAK
jgi:para-aminobenzoate synthetase component 2